MNETASIGIIGGADGPTAVFLSSGASSIEITAQGVVIAVIAMLIAYFIGNISPAILLGKAKGIDIKKEGSGNAGTTNVLRVLGKKAAILTLIIDIAKGAIAVLIGALADYLAFGIGFGATNEKVGYVAMACGLFAFIGHIWPMVFKFKGGKGVATAFGVLLAIHPLMALATLGVVALVVLVTRMVSAGSICGAIALPFIALWLMPDFLFIGIVMAIIVIIKHRANIKRILSGTESKLFRK